MPSLMQQSNLVSFTWWQNVPEVESTNALHVEACFKIVDLSLAEAIHMVSADSKGREATPSLDRRKSWLLLQSLIFFLLEIIIHIPSKSKLYSCYPKTLNYYPGLESRKVYLFPNPKRLTAPPSQKLLWLYLFFIGHGGFSVIWVPTFILAWL